jgi:hypothetical protein
LRSNFVYDPEESSREDITIVFTHLSTLRDRNEREREREKERKSVGRERERERKGERNELARPVQ